MRLYLVRHGKSEYGLEEDAKRPLSPRGREDITAMAAYLVDQDIAVSNIIHSTLTRARQTAEIFAKAIGPGTQMTEMNGIEPWGNVNDFAKVAQTWSHDTMVCGHEPFMGLAAAQLMTGSTDDDVVDVKTGTVMALSPSHYSDNWSMRWMLTPRIVRGPKQGED